MVSFSGVRSIASVLTANSFHCRYEYRTADQLVRDFELMKNNAIKFNGPTNLIAVEAVKIYDYVKDQVDANRDELSALEEAVEEQMNTKPKKKKKGVSKKAPASGTVANFGGVDVNLGDLSQSMHFTGGDDSDSDESFGDGFLGDL